MSSNWGRREFDIEDSFGHTYWLKLLAIGAVGALLITALSGCSIITKPCAPACPPDSICVAGTCVPMAPPQCPAACPEGQECTDPAKGCVAKPVEPTPPPPDPSPVCQPNQNCGCYVKPPGEDWKLLSCSSDQQCKDNVCVAKPPQSACQPKLDPAKSAPANVDANWVSAADQSLPSEFKSAVWRAVRAAQAACPAAWNGDCMKAGEPGIDQGYLLISKALQDAGIDASQARTLDKVYDHLYVRRAPGSKDWNATKLFFYGNGCLITGDGAFTVHGWYTFVGDDPTPPPPPPPVVDACPKEPCPLRVWTADTLPPGWGDNEIGRPAYKFNARVHTMGNFDSTPVVIRQEPFCRAIGLSPYADGTPRAACPVRPDGHPDRELVENWLLFGGPVRDSRNGQDCTPNNTSNPFAGLAGTGNCRVCNSHPKDGDPLQVCTEWF